MNKMRFYTSIIIIAAIFAWVFFLGCGCRDVDPHAGYTSQELYPSDVRKVCVEMFKNDSFRRGIEYDLSRAVAQQLELHSPYKIVGDRRRADTVLYGRILAVAESGLNQQRQLDRPVENRMVLAAEVSWKDLRSGEFILQERRIIADADYAKLLGAGADSAAREAANDLAVRIVEAMEAPW
ncbi:MAG: hypothetical protein JW709_07630 [Sedimentisphaerales bacterium]|nr:hypothetical protein [Sedimentisphaerales bacterium]